MVRDLTLPRVGPRFDLIQPAISKDVPLWSSCSTLIAARLCSVRSINLHYPKECVWHDVIRRTWTFVRDMKRSRGRRWVTDLCFDWSTVWNVTRVHWPYCLWSAPSSYLGRRSDPLKVWPWSWWEKWSGWWRFEPLTSSTKVFRMAVLDSPLFLLSSAACWRVELILKGPITCHLQYKTIVLDITRWYEHDEAEMKDVHGRLEDRSIDEESLPWERCSCEGENFLPVEL